MLYPSADTIWKDESAQSVTYDALTGLLLFLHVWSLTHKSALDHLSSNISHIGKLNWWQWHLYLSILFWTQWHVHIGHTVNCTLRHKANCLPTGNRTFLVLNHSLQEAENPAKVKGALSVQDTGNTNEKTSHRMREKHTVGEALRAERKNISISVRSNERSVWSNCYECLWQIKSYWISWNEVFEIPVYYHIIWSRVKGLLRDSEKEC